VGAGQLVGVWKMSTSALRTVIDGLLVSEHYALGHVVWRTLPKGLTIRLKSQDDLIIVQLSRDDNVPSRDEWKTVIDHWPGQVVVVEEPRELKPQGARRFLRGKLRQSSRLLEG